MAERDDTGSRIGLLHHGMLGVAPRGYNLAVSASGTFARGQMKVSVDGDRRINETWQLCER